MACAGSAWVSSLFGLSMSRPAKRQERGASLQEFFERLIPGRRRLLRAERVESLEDITAYPQPCCIRVVPIDELVPETRRQRITRFSVPGQTHRTECAAFIRVEHASAEKKLERDV